MLLRPTLILSFALTLTLQGCGGEQNTSLDAGSDVPATSSPGTAARSEKTGDFCADYVSRLESMATSEHLALAEMDATGRSDPFGELVGTLALTTSTINDLAVLMESLSDEAPDDIGDDMQAIADAMKASLGSMGGAATGDAGSILSMLVTNMSVRGSYTRFESYVSSACSAEIADSKFARAATASVSFQSDDVSSASGSYEAEWSSARYKFDFDAGYGNVQVVAPEMVDQDAEVTWDWHLHLDVTNEESLGAYPPGRLFGLEGAWPLKSAPCAVAGHLDVLAGLSRTPNDHFPYCLVPLVAVAHSSDPTVAGASPLEAGDHQIIDLTSTYKVHMSNDDAGKVVAALRQGPAFWLSDPYGYVAVSPRKDCEDADWVSTATC